MRNRFLVAMLSLTLLADTAFAETSAPAEPLADEPSVTERRIVAFASTGVAVASLAAGITMGILAKNQFDCVSDVLACNKTLKTPIVGDALFGARAEIEQKAVFADMAFLFAAAATAVATVSYLQGFVFIDDVTATEAPAAAPPPAPAPPATAPATPPPEVPATPAAPSTPPPADAAPAAAPVTP